MTQILETVSETLGQDPRWQLVQRVLASSQFRGSSRLRDFLVYVTECAIREAPQEATEQQIGICVFRRSPGYNSSEDSIVRTHARLLRQKLAGYFAEVGASEDLVIEIPKGQYLPIFHPAELHTPAVERRTQTVPLERVTPSATQGTQHGRNFLLGSVALVVTIVLLGWWRWPKAPTTSSDLDRLWMPFFTSEEPFVIYSNALFEGNSHSGLRVVSPDGGDQSNQVGDHYVESYTGVGEVVAIREITELFTTHHASFILKRSRLVSWDEAKSRNLIFVGAPSQNPALRVLPSTTEFTIIANGDSWAIANLHPKPGEPALYARPEHPLTKDYAIVALLPGQESGKWMMVLSGLTTFGTQAAAEYVCRNETVDALVHAAVQPDRKLRPFEAVLEVSINHDIPLQTRLLSIHLK